MAQGLVKQKVSNKPGKPTGPQRGNRVIKPKKTKLAQQAKLKKKQSAGLAALTEKSLADRAGHLEMLKGGKKDAKDGNKQSTKKSKSGK